MFKKICLTIGICSSFIIAVHSVTPLAYAGNGVYNKSETRTKSTYRNQNSNRTRGKKELTHDQEMALLMDQAYAQIDAEGHLRAQQIRDRRAVLDHIDAQKSANGKITPASQRTSGSSRAVRPATIRPYKASTPLSEEEKPKRLFNYIKRN